jgi:hypothetical protein
VRKFVLLVGSVALAALAFVLVRSRRSLPTAG